MRTVEATVPGKLMLAGEYAVLRGGAAMACTVSSKMHIKASASDSTGIKASSDLLKQTFVLNQISQDDQRRREPLVQLLQYVQDHQPASNLQLEISSDLDVSHGIGSSSALRLGGLLAASTYRKGQTLSADERWDVARSAYLLQHEHQGQASGYDIATQCMGGLTIMRNIGGPQAWPGMIARISSATDRLNEYIIPLVGGAGAPTASYTKQTVEWLNQENKWPALLDISEQLVEDFTKFISAKKPNLLLQGLLESIVKHRQFFADSPAAENQLIPKLSGLDGFDKTWTAKTTGAGGDDAVLLIGPPDVIRAKLSKINLFGWYEAPFSFVDLAATAEWN